MAQVLIRGLEDQVVESWKEKARRNGRSLESELRLALTRLAPITLSDRAARAKAFRESLEGRTFLDSVELLREDRDR